MPDFSTTESTVTLWTLSLITLGIVYLCLPTRNPRH